jgi:Flp pilus assembly protein TadG
MGPSGTAPITAHFRLGAALRAQTTDIRGNVAIEFALTATALLVFLFGILQAGYAMWLQSALDYAVAEAARCASIDTTTCGTASQIQSYASGLSGAGFDSSIFSPTTPSCGNQVSASYPLALTIPTLTISVTLTAQACYPS